MFVTMMVSLVIKVVTIVMIVVVPMVIVMFHGFEIRFERMLCWFAMLIEMMFAVELLCFAGSGLLLSGRKFVSVRSRRTTIVCRVVFCVFEVFLAVVSVCELLSLRRSVVLFGRDSLHGRISL
ncbi:hypothetical protein [Gimesia alba]|uniref:hypothetical protein n=1 Tax=Gimesia alba TaxID=2527973 RepID=UPI0011A56775|nr:hypothetical protein [Gimesia alba]